MPAAPSQPGAEAGGRGTGRPARQHVRNPPEGKPPRPAPARPGRSGSRTVPLSPSSGLAGRSGGVPLQRGRFCLRGDNPLRGLGTPASPGAAPAHIGALLGPGPELGRDVLQRGPSSRPCSRGRTRPPVLTAVVTGRGKAPECWPIAAQILPGSEAAGERRSGRGCHAHSCGGNAGGGARRPLPPAAPPRPPPPLHARLGVGDRRIGPPTAPLLAPRPGGNRLPFHWARCPAFSVQSLRLIVPTGVPRYGVSLTPERSLVPLRRQRLPRRCPAVPA